MPTIHHPCLTALSAVLKDAAGILKVPLDEVVVEQLEAHVWPDTGLGLKAGGRALIPGYLVRLGDGSVYRTDQAGNFAREEPSDDGPIYIIDKAIRLRFTEEGGIVGGQSRFETDSTQLSEVDEAELRALVTEADFFNVRGGDGDDPMPGITIRLWIAVGRRNREIVRNSGITADDPPALAELIAWASQRTPPRSPRIPMEVE